MNLKKIFTTIWISSVLFSLQIQNANATDKLTEVPKPGSSIQFEDDKIYVKDLFSLVGILNSPSSSNFTIYNTTDNIQLSILNNSYTLLVNSKTVFTEHTTLNSFKIPTCPDSPLSFNKNFTLSKESLSFFADDINIKIENNNIIKMK